MKIKKQILFLVFALSVLGFGNYAMAQTAADAFVPSGGFHASKLAPVEKKIVRLYLKAELKTENDVQGVVNFYVDGKQIGGSQPISIVAKRFDEVFIDWQAPYGGYFDLMAVVTLTDANEVNPADNSAYIKDFFVDYDTDGDGVGNTEDIDDDNDGLSDKEEEILGTHPLKIDSDGDGISDGKDTNPTVNDNETAIFTGSDLANTKNSESGIILGNSASNENNGEENGNIEKADLESENSLLTTEDRDTVIVSGDEMKESFANFANDTFFAPSDSVKVKLLHNGQMQIDAAKLVSYLGETDSYKLEFTPENSGRPEVYQNIDKLMYQVEKAGKFNAVIRVLGENGKIARTTINLNIYKFPLAEFLLYLFWIVFLILFVVIALKIKKKIEDSAKNSRN